MRPRSYEARKRLFYNGNDFDRFTREQQEEEMMAAQEQAILAQQRAIEEARVSGGAEWSGVELGWVEFFSALVLWCLPASSSSFRF